MTTDEKDASDLSKTVTKLFGNEIRFHILMLLHAYQELSLSEIAEKLGRTKPTVHRHLQKMIDTGVVEESKEVKARGSIKAKYYSPTNLESELPGIRSSWIFETDCTDEKFRRLGMCIQALRAVLERFRSSIDMVDYYINFFELEKQRGTYADFSSLKQFYEENPLRLDYLLLTERQFEKYEELYEEFLELFNPAMEDLESSEGTQEKKFLVLRAGLPLKRLLDLKHELE